jgi:ribosome recycling factor
LNINPQKDQKFLKLIFPALTTERREQLIKMVNAEKEKARVEIKKIREDAVKKTNNDFKDRTISEDQKFYLEKEIQKVIEETNTKIDDLTNKKETDLRNN